MLNSKNNLISSLIWSVLEQGGARVISLLVQLILARLLVPEVFGVMAILLVWMEIAHSLAQSGFGSALIQKQDVDDLSFTTAFWISMALATLIYALIFFSAPAIEAFYDMDSLAFYLRILSLVLFFECFNAIQRSYFQKKLNFKALFKVTTVAAVISGVIGVIAALWGLGIWALILQTLTQSIVSCIILLIQVPWRPSFHFSKKEGKTLFSYGWKIGVTGILNTLYNGSSELILGRVCGAAYLGFYNQGRKWPNTAISWISTSLQNFLFPAFAQIQNDIDSLRKAITKSIEIGSYVIVPSCFLMALLAEPLVAIFLSEKWLPSVPVFQLVCLENLCLMIQIVNLRAYMALGASSVYLRLQLIKIAIGIVLICGVAVLTQDIYLVALVACFFGNGKTIIDLFPAKKLYGLGFFKQFSIIVPIYLIALASCIPAIAIELLGFSYLAQLGLEVITYLIVYIFLSKIFRLSGYKEIIGLIKELVKG